MVGGQKALLLRQLHGFSREMLFLSSSRKKIQSATERRLKLWSPLEVAVLVEPRGMLVFCISYHKRYSLFSFMSVNMSRDAILALHSVIKGLLAASFALTWVLVMLLQVFSEVGAPRPLCLYLRLQCELIWGAGWLSNWLLNTNAVPYTVKHCVAPVPAFANECSL